MIDSNGNNITFLDPASNFDRDGAEYVMNGTGTYLNSGFIFPENNIPPNFPKISTFTVKFLTIGAYDYQCLIHPEMKGTITVTPAGNPLGINIR